MVTPRTGALYAVCMLQGMRLPLARGFCVVFPRHGSGAFTKEVALPRVDVARALCLSSEGTRTYGDPTLPAKDPSVAKSRLSTDSMRGVARRLTRARLCMSSSEASPVAEKPQAEARAMEEEVDPGEVEGTDLRVLKYPHPALRAKNEEIESFDDDLKKLAKDMFKVMYASKGVGLAAPQVGVNKRLMVFNPEGDARNWLDEAVLVNPRIVGTGKGKVIDEEGCLSFPGMRGNVERRNWVKIEAQNVKGKTMKKKYTDWTARIFQHEYDHLDGTVYIDRLTPEGKKKVQPVLDKLISDFGEGAAL